MHKRIGLAGLVGLIAFAFAATATAQGGEIYDWKSEEAPVLVHNESGLIFLSDDKKPWRAYQWDRADGDKKRGLYLVDIDKDGETEVVGAGDPTFALHPSSNPAWSIEEGCEQVIVANFAADDKLDLMCNQGTEIHIYTHDRQKVWSLDLGVRLDWCRADDLNGDLKMDLECKYGDRDAYIRLDAEGDILAQESEETEMEDGAISHEEAMPVGAGILKGEQEFDLNGDGAAEESLLADGEALVVQSRSQKKAVARIELGGKARAALVKNLDGEGNPEIVALTDSEIIVEKHKGEKLGTYSADAGDYRRYPVAEFESIYARKFEDNEKAQKVVKGAKEELAKCYERRVRGSLFVGIGQVIFKVYVDGEGKVTNIERMHSAIRDQKVESCAKGILEDLEYPKYGGNKEGDEKEGEGGSATVNVVMKFTFADGT